MNSMDQSLGKLPLETLFQHLNSSRQGLSNAEAKARLVKSGYNDPIAKHNKHLVKDLIKQFFNPLLIILIVASVLEAILGEFINSIVILLMVSLSVIINFVQSFRSKNALDILRHSVAPQAKVLRDNRWQEIERRNVVPGDIVRFLSGDLVPADAKLVEAVDLFVQESALTGESFPVQKHASDENSRSSDDLSNNVFLGSSVISGSGTAIIYATGECTIFGEVASRLATKPPETEFERGTNQFSILISKTVFILVVLVFLINALLGRNLLQSLMFSVALAVGLTPEFLPMIIAVTLSQGALNMSKRKVIVKSLPALQNLGSIDILCSDKTGTLTTGEMEVIEVLDCRGQRQNEVLQIARLNSYFETGVKSPLDEAILKNIEPSTFAGFEKTGEVPFDFQRRRLSIAVRRNKQNLLIVKGAPEAVLSLCRFCHLDHVVVDFNDKIKEQANHVISEMSAKGLRVLAVGTRKLQGDEKSLDKAEFDLVLEGFLAFSDPPLDDAAVAISKLYDDGVRVKILTGDHPLVAKNICEQVGIDASELLLGDDIDRVNDAALGKLAEKINVFARVSPTQKNRIILALKHRGHVVGYIGDGVNDAPSLHNADVGISAAAAVDVAREAAGVVLIERRLTVLHGGIIEGRVAFGNVMKYLLMGTSSNFGNMLSMAVASLFLPFLPMLPSQILLNNVLYDFAQLTIPTDSVDEIYARKPHNWDISVIRKFMTAIGPISSAFDFVTFVILLQVFHADEAFFQTGWFVESMLTQSLVLFVIRTVGSPFANRPSLFLFTTVLLIVFMALWLPFSPLAAVFGFVPLSFPFLLFILLVTGVYLIVVQIIKRKIMEKLMEVKI